VGTVYLTALHSSKAVSPTEGDGKVESPQNINVIPVETSDE
jgi:hypothetical protein